jgi:flagellar biogenesis protein FliO
MVARTVYALATIAAILAVLRWAARRFAGGHLVLRPRSRRLVEVQEFVALPHDAAVVVVRVGERRVVVAVGRGSVSALCELSE